MDPLISNFLSRLTMPTPGTINCVLTTVDTDWSVILIRQKAIQTYYYRQPQYVVAVSTVRQMDVNIQDSDVGNTVSAYVDSIETHGEIEVLL